MSEESLVRYCAPTLAGLKTGSLFACPYRDRADVCDAVRALNERLRPKGLRLLPLKMADGRALLYLYRPARLEKDLCAPEAQALLTDAGYDDLRAGRCVGTLMKRLQNTTDFPHEIGLFLSYPPEDVRGFIEHGGKDCKCCGLWKVYGDEAAAKRLFCAYRACTETYRKRQNRGVPLERLAVAEG
ncbi:MAG: DUF3793 family protein [Clostridia bacterium]|nr:DUF3793 family protein [Clostridia bacterium]